MFRKQKGGLQLDDLSIQMKTDPEEGTQRLLKEYGGLVYYTVRRILRSYPDDDVEECAADVFCYLYRHRKRLDFAGDTFKAYLVRTAEHMALDHLRRAARTPVPTEDLLWNTERAERSAEEEALASLSREELIRRVLALGEPDATILLGKYWLGLSSEELGTMLGMKPNTVVQRAGRALKRIRETWKGEDV